MAITKNTELRKLGPAEFHNFALILSPSDSWKKLVSVVTKDENENVPKFNGESITILEEASRNERKPAAAVFLEEWSTMGRKRPTLGLFLHYLMKAQLFRAADYLAENILKIEPPTRPSDGPAVTVDAEEALAELLNQQNLNGKEIASDYSSRSAINLSRVDYPTHLLKTEKSDSDNNCPVYENQVGVFEMRCSQSRSHQVLEPGKPLGGSREPDKVEAKSKDEEKVFGEEKTWKFSQEFRNADWIEFSPQRSERLVDKTAAISDLMKFHSTNIGLGNKSIKSETCEAMLPDFDALRGDSIGDREKSLEKSQQQTNFIQEMSSSELPVILKDFERPVYFHQELSTSELPVCINDRSDFDTSDSKSSSNDTFDDPSSSISDSSSASVETTPNDKKSQTSIYQLNNLQRAFDSQELPITVLEFQHR